MKKETMVATVLGLKKHVRENKEDLQIPARQDNDLEREYDEKSFKRRRKRQGLYT